MDSVWDSVRSFFGSSDSLPWTDAQAIEACERDVSDAGQTGAREDNLLRLAWALVHSRSEADVQRGIAMLEDMLSRGLPSKEKRREALYLAGVGYFRAGDYLKCRRAADDALLETPEFLQASNLKKMVERKIASEGVIGVGIAAGAVAVAAAVAAAALSRH